MNTHLVAIKDFAHNALKRLENIRHVEDDLALLSVGDTELGPHGIFQSLGDRPQVRLKTIHRFR